MVFPSGELHISQVDQMDSQLQYRCQTRNKLTGELKQSSNAGRLIITGKALIKNRNNLILSESCRPKTGS